MNTVGTAPHNVACVRKLRAFPISQFMRYCVIGLVNTIFGYTIYYVAARIGASTWFALCVSTASGVIFNFCTTGSVVFQQLSWRCVPKFVCAYAGIFFLNLGALRALSPILDGRIVAEATLLMPMACLSFFTLRTFVFDGKQSRATREVAA